MAPDRALRPGLGVKLLIMVLLGLRGGLAQHVSKPVLDAFAVERVKVSE
jgi:hypothetical protein